MTEAKKETAKLAAPLALKIIQAPQRIVINSPVAGKISVVTLQGRLVKSMTTGTAAPVIWDIRDAAKGLYLLKVENEKQMLKSMFFIQ